MTMTTTVTTAYHVADPSYVIGTDLYCRDSLIEQGRAPEWKWDPDLEGADGDVICVFDTQADAEAFRRDWLPAGRILAVKLTDELRTTRVSEGYLAVYYRIPAHVITDLDLTE